MGKETLTAKVASSKKAKIDAMVEAGEYESQSAYIRELVTQDLYGSDEDVDSDVVELRNENRKLRKENKQLGEELQTYKRQAKHVQNAIEQAVEREVDNRITAYDQEFRRLEQMIEHLSNGIRWNRDEILEVQNNQQHCQFDLNQFCAQQQIMMQEIRRNGPIDKRARLKLGRLIGKKPKMRREFKPSFNGIYADDYR